MILLEILILFGILLIVVLVVLYKKYKKRLMSKPSISDDYCIESKDITARYYNIPIEYKTDPVKIQKDYNILMSKYNNIEITIHILILLYMHDIRSIWKEDGGLFSGDIKLPIYKDIGIVIKNGYNLVYNIKYQNIIDDINSVKEYSKEYDIYLGEGLGYPCPWKKDNEYTGYYNETIKNRIIFNFYIKYNGNIIELYPYICGNIKINKIADLYNRHIMIFERLCYIINSIHNNNLTIISRVDYEKSYNNNIFISEYDNNSIIDANYDICHLKHIYYSQTYT